MRSPVWVKRFYSGRHATVPAIFIARPQPRDEPVAMFDKRAMIIEEPEFAAFERALDWLAGEPSR
jgi:hypothetical protein